MLDLALPSRSVVTLSPRRPANARALAAALGVLVLATPCADARADTGAPSDASTGDEVDELAAEARALDRPGHHHEAARVWERVAAETADPDRRTTALLHAHDAWRLAAEERDEPADRCADRALLAAAADDPGIDVRARDDFRAMLGALEAEALECSERPEDGRPRVALLGDPQPSSAGPPASAPSSGDDGPGPRSAWTSAGAIALGVAAPILGGAIFALVDDVRVAAEITAFQARVDAGDALSEGERARVGVLGERARLDRDLALGLGISGLVLSGVGVALLVRGRRDRLRDAPLRITPTAGIHPGLTLHGRF